MTDYTVLLAGFDPVKSPIRRHLQRSANLAVIDVAAHVAPARKPATPAADPDVVVVGPELVQPLAVAGLLRQHSPGAQVVFLVGSERVAEFRASLPFVPQLSDSWTVSTDDSAETVGEIVLAAARTARRRDLARPREPELDSAWNAALGEALRRERQIQLSERFMATVLTQAPDPIFALNAQGEIVSSNDAAFRLFLNNPRALVGQHASGLFAPDVQAEARELFERARKGEVIERYVTRIAVNAENLRDAAISVSAVRESTSEIVGYSMTVRDITELREAERRLADARRELAHVARRTLFAAMSGSIAHEVRQPVSAIVVCAEAALRWLDRDKPDIAEARDALNQILEDAARTNEIVTNIRSMFQHGEPQAGPVDMNEVVREVLALMQGELDRHSVMIRPELQQVLPKIPGERVPLQQVLINIIVNAVDAMAALPRGSACLEIRTKSHVNRTVLVSVTDNGGGIDPALATRVFEPFYTTKSQGMGMGLHICRTIVEGHGGRLWAAPAIPRGTTFQIELSMQPVKNA